MKNPIQSVYFSDSDESIADYPYNAQTTKFAASLIGKAEFQNLRISKGVDYHSKRPFTSIMASAEDWKRIETLYKRIKNIRWN